MLGVVPQTVPREGPVSGGISGASRPIAGGEYIILSALKQPLALFAPVTNGACYLPGL